MAAAGLAQTALWGATQTRTRPLQGRHRVLGLLGAHKHEAGSSTLRWVGKQKGRETGKLFFPLSRNGFNLSEVRDTKIKNGDGLQRQ